MHIKVTVTNRIVNTVVVTILCQKNWKFCGPFSWIFCALLTH